MLAQQMLRSDRATALFRLGIDEAFADLIESMSAAKLVRMASIPTLLPCLPWMPAARCPRASWTSSPTPHRNATM